jgi:hypothetical protein
LILLSAAPVRSQLMVLPTPTPTAIEIRLNS